MKLNRYTVFGLIVITIWVSFATAKVGEIYDGCNTPTEWHLPITVFLAVGAPFILGYLGGNRK